MWGQLLRCRRKRKAAFLVEVLGGVDFLDAQVAFGQCAGLIEHSHAQLRHLLDRFTALHMDTLLCQTAVTAQEAQRYGNQQRSRAADHEDGQRTVNPYGDRRARIEQRRDHGQQDCQHNNYRDELCRAVCHTLFERCLALFPIFLYMLDLVDRAVLKPCGSAQQQQGTGIQAASQHTGIFYDLDRFSVAGQDTVIDRPFAAQDNAVDRNALARTDQYKIADADLGRRDAALLALHIDNRSLLRHKTGLLGERLMRGTKYEVADDFANPVQDQDDARFCAIAKQECAQGCNQDEQVFIKIFAVREIMCHFGCDRQHGDQVGDQIKRKRKAHLPKQQPDNKEQRCNRQTDQVDTDIQYGHGLVNRFPTRRLAARVFPAQTGLLTAAHTRMVLRALDQRHARRRIIRLGNRQRGFLYRRQFRLFRFRLRGLRLCLRRIRCPIHRLRISGRLPFCSLYGGRFSLFCGRIFCCSTF